MVFCIAFTIFCIPNFVSKVDYPEYQSSHRRIIIIIIIDLWDSEKVSTKILKYVCMYLCTYAYIYTCIYDEVRLRGRYSISYELLS